LVKNRQSELTPHLFGAPVEGDFVGIRRDLWPQKIRVPGLSCSIVCVILHLAVLIQYWHVTGGHTHEHHSIYCASIALDGKNVVQWLSGCTGWRHF